MVETTSRNEKARTDKRRAASAREREARVGIARCESLHNDPRLINFYRVFILEVLARCETHKRLCASIDFHPPRFIYCFDIRPRAGIYFTRRRPRDVNFQIRRARSYGRILIYLRRNVKINDIIGAYRTMKL